jgi:hypothetical protein
MPAWDTKRKWSAEEDERLRKYIGSGGSAARAAVAFRRTEAALRARATELGLKFPLLRELRAKAGLIDPRKD